VGEVGVRLGMGVIAVSNAGGALVDERLAVIGDEIVATEPEAEAEDDEAATTTLEDVVADLGASPELDVVVQAELAPGEVVVDPSSLGGSRAVDLDTALDSHETGHAYLAEDPQAPVDLPEPLPAELYAEPEAPVEASTDPESLAQMSQRAAEAIAAAEGGEAPVEPAADAESSGDAETDENGEQPMNRNLLMKFISSK
jgi:hypothetical protein